MIRKTILAKEGKIYELALDTLNEILLKERENNITKLPPDWTNERNDRGLLMAVSEKGIGFLK